MRVIHFDRDLRGHTHQINVHGGWLEIGISVQCELNFHALHFAALLVLI